MSLALSFLWHMHQPDYRDDSGVMGMPWVFLHALKDYYDMPWLLERYPGQKATFNLTPTLIMQLKLYAERGAEADRFLRLWRKEPGRLGDAERREVRRICTSARFETMVKPLPRFAELYGQTELDDDQFRDLEVCFLLSWCGNYLRENDDTVRRLLAKGWGYDAGEKEALLETLLAFVPTILPNYARLWKAGRIELSTTPLDHPILPLLTDMENARRSNPAVTLPADPLSLADDAREQVRRALELFGETFGAPPRGLWPAEGAVDASTLAIYREAGLEWVATDEAILFASLGSRERSKLYRPWEFAGIRIAFRDHPLSDRIGFTYQHWAAERAAEDFLSALESIAAEEGEATVAVILDGENAWEFYPDNARPFFEALYGRLERSEAVRSVTCSEALSAAPQRLERLHPGSWIYGTFDTWVGHPEKNAAWELLYQTRRDYERHRESLDAQKQARCLEHFLAAECSDWFWWYGEDHYTEFSREFDALFRSRLIAVYREAGLRPPANLFRPIGGERGENPSLLIYPKFPITPKIDGRVDSFFEWLGSGMSDEARQFGTMDGARRGPVRRLHWGRDRKHLYLRLDGDLSSLREKGWLDITLGPKRWHITLDDPSRAPEGIRWALDEVLELALPLEPTATPEPVTLRIEVGRDGEWLQILPGAGELRIAPSGELERCWFV